VTPGLSSEEQRLLAAHIRYLRDLGTGWGASRAESLTRELASGWLSPLDLGLPAAEHVLALADRVSHQHPRVHALQLDPPAGDRLAQLLDAPLAGPMASVDAVCDLIEGVGADRQARIFASPGFSHRSMVRMELAEGVPLPAPSDRFEIRPLQPSDRAAFVASYARIYPEPQGDYWLTPYTSVEEDARAFFDQFLTPVGEWGPKLIRSGSLACICDGRLAGTILAGRSRQGEDHLYGLAVDPNFQRRGIGRALLAESIARLRRAGGGAVSLSVVRGGIAHGMYGSVGFREIPPPAGRMPGYWMRGPPAQGT